MFNTICNEDLNGAARQELIASFVAECNANGATRRSARNTISGQHLNDNDGVSETPISLPFWVIDQDRPGFDQDAMSY